MKRRRIVVLAVSLALSAISLTSQSACAATTMEVQTDVQREINYLLGFVAKSGCAFYRNGTWYDSEKAQQHLRKKYDYAMAVSSAEQFIERIATSSSFSNEAYQVRCNDGITLTSNRWLNIELARYRQKPVK